jgi:hypothetical protein
MFKRGMLALLALLLPALCWGASDQINPPGVYCRKVSRHIQGNARFRLVAQGRPIFSIMIPSTSDQLTDTAAHDTARYFSERGGSVLPLVHDIGSGSNNLFVLSDLDSRGQLRKPLRNTITDVMRRST